MINPSWIGVDKFVYVAVQHSRVFCAVQHFFVVPHHRNWGGARPNNLNRNGLRPQRQNNMININQIY
jgi:hypothetical protein